MKLLRLGKAGSELPALMTEEGTIRDISDYVPEIDGEWLASGGISRLQEVLRGELQKLPILSISDMRISTPIARPGNIIAIGLNYRDHALEAGMDIPSEPIIFSKAPSSFSGPNDNILLPPGSLKTDWEVELGVVIGKETKYISEPSQSLEYIAGYCVVNDVSEREYQFERGPTWIKGKSAPSFCPTGPWLVTRDEMLDPGNLSMKLFVNEVLRQQGSTKTMIFDVAYVVWYCSQFMTLEPGDLIATGTPPGVGMGLEPPVYLRDGDIVELEIEGLGRQRQRVSLT